MLKNSLTRYGLIAKGFHWSIALMIIGLLALGLIMGDIEGPVRGQLYGIHKSFGVTVLILMIGRLCWRVYNNRLPQDNHAHPKYERLLANTVHALLYVAAIAMPLSGWGMSSAGDHPVALFGLPLPPLVSPDKELGAVFSAAHSVLGWTLIVLISLHILGALKHVFIDRDNTLSRMLFGRDKG